MQFFCCDNAVARLISDRAELEQVLRVDDVEHFAKEVWRAWTSMLVSLWYVRVTLLFWAGDKVLSCPLVPLRCWVEASLASSAAFSLFLCPLRPGGRLLFSLSCAQHFGVGADGCPGRPV